MGIFKEIKVLELGRVFSGPLCGMVLADIGAEVIKVERPGSGDESRQFGSDYFNSLNRNKKSIALDLKNPEHKAVLMKLIERSDVLVHNWLQESLDQLGFSYEGVKIINPRLIYCAISGYGYNSTYRNQPAQDIIAQGLSGFMSLTGEQEGLPLKTGIPVVDYTTGLYAAYSIMSALYMREKTGEGQLVHTSLLETALAMTSFEGARYLTKGEEPHRKGNRHPNICPYNVYRTKDGLVTVAVANQEMWKRFCEALKIEYLMDLDLFSSNPLRLINQDILEPLLEAEMVKYSSEEITFILKNAKVSCTRIHSIKEAFACPEIKELNQVLTTTSKQPVSLVGMPFHLEKIEERAIEAPPVLDAHKDEILRALGLKLT